MPLNTHTDAHDDVDDAISCKQISQPQKAQDSWGGDDHSYNNLNCFVLVQ